MTKCILLSYLSFTWFQNVFDLLNSSAHIRIEIAYATVIVPVLHMKDASQSHVLKYDNVTVIQRK